MGSFDVSCLIYGAENSMSAEHSVFSSSLCVCESFKEWSHRTGKMPKKEWWLFRLQCPVPPLVLAFQMDSWATSRKEDKCDQRWLPAVWCSEQVWAPSWSEPRLMLHVFWTVLPWKRLISFYYDFLDYLWTSSGLFSWCNAYGFRRSLLWVLCFFA